MSDLIKTRLINGDEKLETENQLTHAHTCSENEMERKRERQIPHTIQMRRPKTEIVNIFQKLCVRRTAENWSTALKTFAVA